MKCSVNTVRRTQITHDRRHFHIMLIHPIYDGYNDNYEAMTDVWLFITFIHWSKKITPTLFKNCIIRILEYFIQGLLMKNGKKLARSFNFTFRYIDDLLSLNNSKFGDFVDRIYPNELE